MKDPVGVFPSMFGSFPLSVFGEIFTLIGLVKSLKTWTTISYTSYTVIICKASQIPHKPGLRNVAFAPVPVALTGKSIELVSGDLVLVRR